MILSPNQIIDLIEKPKNREILEKAKDYEQELRHFYCDDYPDLIYNKVKKILTDEKLKAFKQVYKNYAQPIINKIETHYGKIFTSYGAVFENNFGDNIAANVLFDDLKEVIYNGMSDKEYWQNVGHTKCLTQPNSIYLTGMKKEGINILHIPLENIHDVDEDEGGIKYLILCYQKKVDKKEKKYYYVYDETFFYLLTETNEGIVFVTDETGEAQTGEHGATKCPAVFASSDNLKDGFILKKSRYSDSLHDLYEYVILKTFYQNYKYFSAFGKEIKAQTMCNYRNTDKNVQCNGSGELQVIDKSQNFEMSVGGACPNCSKNKGVMGEVVTIPIQMQGNETFVSNLDSLFRRIDADSNILTFHSDDLENLENKIFSDSVGAGFGQSFRKQAFNQDQVGASLDDIESNLNDYIKYVEQTWNYSLTRAGEMFSDSFVSTTNKLGRTHFLKDTNQLYAELETIKNTSSDPVLLEKKRKEIFLTESKNDPGLIKRADRIEQIKPFVSFSPEYVSSNIQVLQAINPESVSLYFFFDQVLAIFEANHGKIEDFGTEMIDEYGFVDEKSAVKEIKNIFQQIMTENGITTSGPEREERGTGDPEREVQEPVQEGQG